MGPYPVGVARPAVSALRRLGAPGVCDGRRLEAIVSEYWGKRLHLDSGCGRHHLFRGAPDTARGQPAGNRGPIHLRARRGAARRCATVAGSLRGRRRGFDQIAGAQTGELRPQLQRIQGHRNVLPAALGSTGGCTRPYAAGVGLRNALLGGSGGAATQALRGSGGTGRRGLRTRGSAAYRLLLAERVVLVVTCVDRSIGRAAIGPARGPIARLTAAFVRGPAPQNCSVRMVQAQARAGQYRDAIPTNSPALVRRRRAGGERVGRNRTGCNRTGRNRTARNRTGRNHAVRVATAAGPAAAVRQAAMSLPCSKDRTTASR